MFYSVANKGSETEEKKFLENISRAMERKYIWFFFFLLSWTNAIHLFRSTIIE